MATTNLSLGKGSSKSKLGAQHDGNMDILDAILGNLLAAKTTANGAKLEIKSISEEVTLAAAANTDTAANLLPANALILAVVARVTTVIPTATDFCIGDATTAARFGSGVLVAANTTHISVGQWNPANTDAAGPVQSAAAKIRITPQAQPATATGKVRLTVFYLTAVAPTS